MFIPTVTSYCILAMALQAHAFFHEKSMKPLPKPPDLQNNSLFGYSIAYQSGIGSLLVSAPTGNNDGKIYAIDMNNFTITEESFTLYRGEAVKEHNYWLGATVRATSNFFVTCSPRYAELKYNTQERKERQFVTLGICFKKLNNVFILKTITNRERRINADSFTHRMDSFGWSIHVTPKQNDILIGGPAMSIGRVSRFNGKSGAAQTPSLIYAISKQNPVKFNFGYSIESGNFFSSGTVYAISTTYGDAGYGKIYFFDTNLNNIGAIVDTEVGTMFGAALCTAMLKGHTLLVGAPAYADDEHSFNVGAVYIYGAQSAGSKNMILKKKVIGMSNSGYFGYNILNLGDMDGDGNDEIAIAAPYDDGNKGAVYIYSGVGILEGRPWKKIHFEGLYSFGFSLTILQDHNEIGCNDLAIGAIESASVVLIKCMGFITVNLDSTVTILEKHDKQTIVQIQSCVIVEYPEKLKSVSADLIMDIKITDQKSILTNASTDNVYTYLEKIRDKQSSFCRNITASNPTGIGEYSQVIAYSITASLKENPEEIVYDPSKVLLSERSVLSIVIDKWASECGSGHTSCTPTLKLNFTSTMSEPYIIGSTTSEQFSLSILNSGETAHMACAIVNVVGAKIHRAPSGCTLQDDVEGLLCKHKDPIHNGDSWFISDITLNTKYLTSAEEYVTVETNLYNHCNEPNDSRTFEKKFSLIGDTEYVSITGKSNPEEIIDITPTDITTDGKAIEHLYIIYNNGMTNWIGVQIEVFLEYAPYIGYPEVPIKIYSEMTNIECAMDNKTQINNTIAALCNIGDLQTFQRTTVVIAMDIVPNTLGLIVNPIDYFFTELDENKPNVTVMSSINILKINKYSSVETVLSLQVTSVALWIIITSCVIGLVLISLIAFALYKFGFLRRKNKDKLVALKKEVYRQSIRRSMIRESMRAAAKRKSNEDNQTLMNSTEETCQADVEMVIDEKLRRK